MMKKYIMRIFWESPLFSYDQKEKIYYFMRKVILNRKYHYKANDVKIYEEYAKQVLSIPQMKSSEEYVPISDSIFERKNTDPKLIAYYLPQFYPFKENDEWWGKGTTEWNNVSRAVPQFLGHYQPRLPGELGYYDLRLKENIARQVELAKLYGLYGFCYYYYWFDGKRLLDKPLDLFLESKDIDFPFCLCWANENWTKRFDGISGEVIMKQSNTVESYKEFIGGLEKYFKDERYLTVDGKKLIIVYKPSLVPDSKNVIEYWRKYCRKRNWGELYIIGVKENDYKQDLLRDGYDAASEFNPGSIANHFIEITDTMEYVAENFYGMVFDYKDLVENKKYFNDNAPKLYKAVMPMWDNTARRNDRGHIFHGSSPELYGQWLLDSIINTRMKTDLEEQFIFINAWNEWGEGAYLEPDRKYGYAYLQATKDAIEKSRL